MSAADVSAKAADLASALAGCTTNPGDQIRILSSLMDFSEPGAAAGNAISDLFRRSIMGQLSLACSQYQPSSYDDAAALRKTMADLFDDEIVVAGDAGQDATYSVLLNLRTAVLQDLTDRGSDLPRLKIFTAKTPVSALVTAYRLYQDSSRGDDLVSRVDPVHPAFMPLSFTALGS